MDDTSRSRMTFRQALAGQWQIPVFLLSLVAFVGVLVLLRPQKEIPTFEEQYAQLEQLAQEGRFVEFYSQAETLRLQVENQSQLGQVHLLVARTRTRQLQQKHQMDLDHPESRSAPANYEHLIKDYRQALACQILEAEDPACVEIYRDVALAFWCLNQSEQAISSVQMAIEVSPQFDCELQRLLIRMILFARPKDYLTMAADLLEQFLAQPDLSAEDKAWAFVRKADLLITQGHEQQALEMLNTADAELRNSSYGLEMEFLRGRALHHTGKPDQAEKILRDLLARIPDRGDIYAQTAIELGKINYEQYRDYDARHFYQLVVDSQVGKDWYVAAKRGLAECAAMQHRYQEAALRYQEAVDLLNKNPGNRAISLEQVQSSLVVLAHQLSLIKQYDTALMFLEIEQQIVDPHDREAVMRFAHIHAYLAQQLFEQLSQADAVAADTESSPTDQLWHRQQRQLASEHAEQAAQQYARLALLAVEDDKLYDESLWQAATFYDKAGNTDKAIETWLRFVVEREGQVRWPDALFHLAQAYQAVGQIDQAVSYYQNLRDKHPISLAALKATVPLAKCLLAQEPPDYEHAEVLLRQVLSDPLITPAASHFRDAMFELGKLYYENGQYMQAINILTEVIDRYPDSGFLGHAMFLTGNSYRQSGLALDSELAQLDDDPADMVTRENTFKRRNKYLQLGQQYFNQAVDFYQKRPDSQRSTLDDLYLRQSWLYRADCLFDLQNFRDAVLGYEEAALRYQLTPTALSALMQIINCHIQLGNLEEARAANQRAVWQLRKMSDQAFDAGQAQWTRLEWQQWFEWLENSGLW